MKSLLIEALKVSFVDVLAKHDKLYHFDDDPDEIIESRTNKKCFTDAEVVAIRLIVEALGSADANESLHELALKKLG